MSSSTALRGRTDMRCYSGQRVNDGWSITTTSIPLDLIREAANSIGARLSLTRRRSTNPALAHEVPASHHPIRGL